MDNLKKQCYKMLDLLEKSILREESNYSIKRIKHMVNQLLNEINNGEIIHKNIDFQSLARNYVDDTGDYSSTILIELEKLAKYIDEIEKE
ncbi:hypothetical protein LISE100100_10395 [Listeria seeligeri]|uniref:hypothetical protein n=1 Tax=Listeria seeligeri TaxID=1640 RepID=UPI0001C4EB30|nr:hypothetical protein [Listeria seeligeri]CBH28203.1 hypothetical protein lse_2052 [Listeria seeligeri serovar 1/2b str. SLCC3954]